MSIISTAQAITLKEIVKKQFKANLHFHDSCCGQYFSFDSNINEALKSFLIEYFDKTNQKAVFSESGNSFYIEEN